MRGETELMVEPMMTARQVAEVLGVHENWVYDQAVGGDLPSYKIGGARRFDPGEVRGWVAEHREAELQRQAPHRVTRRLRMPAAVRSREARPEERELEPERQRPKRPGDRGGGAAAETSGEAQPRLFES